MCPPKKGSGTNSASGPSGCFARLVPDPFLGDACVKDENALAALACDQSEHRRDDREGDDTGDESSEDGL